nr:unnamed protein product [Spirometra erinaceieuropaei]
MMIIDFTDGDAVAGNVFIRRHAADRLFFFFFFSYSYFSPPQSPDWQDNPRSNRPERRTALVARELARYKVDIAALSETRFSEQGQLEELGAGYTFF